ncbi:MAG: hypothetical protein V4649_13260 [Bacteroidota bacterium]
MEVDKPEWRLLQKAIKEWEDTGKLAPEQAANLRKSVVLKRTERQLIAQYFFFIALFCILLAFGALFLNDKLLEKLKVYFSWNDFAISAVTAVLSVLWFWYVTKKKWGINPAAYEVYMVLGGLSALTSLIYMCKQLGTDRTYTMFFGLAIIMLGVLSARYHSKALWMGALVALVCWFWAFTTWQSTDYRFLGMNYPMRYTVLGLVLLGAAYLQQRVKKLQFSPHLTYIAGLVIFFTGFWGVSIFGNFNTLVGWQQVRQVHVLAYSIFFGAASAISFYLGVRYRDDLARDFGIIFLLINLYTRYFEYFWDTLNKGLFFLILAITFGLLGRWLEKKRRLSFRGHTLLKGKNRN